MKRSGVTCGRGSRVLERDEFSRAWRWGVPHARSGKRLRSDARRLERRRGRGLDLEELPQGTFVAVVVTGPLRLVMRRHGVSVAWMGVVEEGIDDRRAGATGENAGNEQNDSSATQS